MNSIFIRRAAVGSLLLAPLMASAEVMLIGGDMKFHGTVIALPCEVASGDEVINIDFGKVNVKEIYLNKKVAVKSLNIHLEHCRTDVFNSVSVTFNGTEDSALANHIAITPDGQDGASGVAIGFQELNGTPIKLGEPTATHTITEDSMVLSWQVYLEGAPEAIEHQTIRYGSFGATATWTLNYQ
jgi:type 1 fimbria pilin